MKLQELLKDVAVKNSTAAQDIEIKEVRYDSRAVQPGDLFVAIRGYATDGHKYIAKAMEQGAAGGGRGGGIPALSARRRRRASPQSLWRIPVSRWLRLRQTASVIRQRAWSCSV